ncbi:GMC family oxidoreductase [Novosphingopyxis sp.]|uniref:GMC family oxidoreductase n=1 Tax=Novosphingopyxis sp. TaxID=2709690 RepID=UPI003B5B4FDC
MNEFDVIIVGGGSAGSAIAGRLSADPSLSICLVEAGGTNDDWRVKTPGMMPFLPEHTNWFYSTIPQKGLNGRMGHQPRGKGMGGSSAINAMLYIRGNAWDYDNWAAMGCTGWAYDDVLPYFKRSESNERGESEYHGGDGPLSVSDQHSVNPGSRAFVASAARLQLPRNEDFNGANQTGFGIYQTTTKSGERWTASRAYVDPVKARANLHVMTGCLTEKLIVEDGHVRGVRIGRKGHSETLHARGAVVLSAGAFGSPQILQLSGIGPAEHLRHHGIDVVLDKPSVGANLQDHVDYVASFETQSKDFIGDSLAGTLRMAKAMIEHRLRRTGIMTTPYAEAGGFWSRDPQAPAPQIQFHFVPAMLEDHGREKVKGHGFSCHACVLRPESRGSVRLKSNEPGDMPAIDPAFLKDARDVALLRAGVRQMYRIFDAPPLSDYRPKDRHPVDLNDDDALDRIMRDRSDTVYHPVGSCAMGPEDSDVLTPRLKFRGLEGLYVADASVMPRIVSGNTNAPSIMIGERCADFLAEDLR